MAQLREDYPQHFAMTYLGLVTGLRPSTLRPLRRHGAQADVKWDEKKVLVRRSQTVGEEVMRTTKQKQRYTIALPDDVMEILRWHVDTQLTTPEMQESDLLFPSVTGGFRSPSVLNKPFADVAEIIGLGKRFTQKGLRRTFNDLMRTERVENVVRNSIAGWASDRMPDRIYPTVAADEQRSAIGKLAEVIDLGAVRGSAQGGSAQAGSAQGSAQAPSAVHGNEKAG